MDMEPRKRPKNDHFRQVPLRPEPSAQYVADEIERCMSDLYVHYAHVQQGNDSLYGAIKRHQPVTTLCGSPWTPDGFPTKKDLLCPQCREIYVRTRPYGIPDTWEEYVRTYRAFHFIIWGVIFSVPTLMVFSILGPWTVPIGALVFMLVRTFNESAAEVSRPDRRHL